MSLPAGLGILHFVPGDFPDKIRKAYEEKIEAGPKYEGDCIFIMDYVQGRQCKMYVWQHPDDLEQIVILPEWYSHGDWQLEELLTRLGVEDAMAKIQQARKNSEEDREE